MKGHRVPIAGFAVGLILGMAMVQAKTYVARQHLLQEVGRLSVTVRHLERETLRLRDHIAALNRQPSSAPSIHSITLEVIKSPVPLIDVEGALEIYTEPLLGVPLAHLKLTLLYHLFEDRRITLDHTVYRVHVVGFIASTDTTIVLRLEKRP